ncbi:MAG: methionyl-tRNA formyltransferase [Bacteroidales bacterium]|nr:methionyl-tRNA formyltransferase [Bacteroidales bacterium]
MNKDFRIVFMGTPSFAVQSLLSLIKAGYQVAGVVTAPDKPSGRGRKILPSPVKQCALENGIPVLQPEKLKDPGFIRELKKLNPDLQVVVAFRMLPEVVWELPPSGTINLHASLLPQYRGAAPINWAIINGEKITGITTFFIRHDIDTGNIILQEKLDISPDETAGELHDRLMMSGASLVEETVGKIILGNVTTIDQRDLIEERIELKKAPKIFTEDCRIKWNEKVDQIYNFIRGLSPFPGAWSEWQKEDGDILFLKIFTAQKETIDSPRSKLRGIIDPLYKFLIALANPAASYGECARRIHPIHSPGTIITDYKTQLEIAATDGYITILNLQQAGKKRMDVAEFLRGIKDLEDYALVPPGD